MSVFSREIPIEQVFTRPQLIAIEVLSPEDRHSLIAEKIKNYMRFGVQNIWIVDSKTREGWDCSNGDWVRTERFGAANTPMYLSLTDLFATIDKRQCLSRAQMPGTGRRPLSIMRASGIASV